MSCTPRLRGSVRNFSQVNPVDVPGRTGSASDAPSAAHPEVEAVYKSVQTARAAAMPCAAASTVAVWLIGTVGGSTHSVRLEQYRVVMRLLQELSAGSAIVLVALAICLPSATPTSPDLQHEAVTLEQHIRNPICCH
eukprot:2728-Heterococcus_DN1.PRE.6